MKGQAVIETMVLIALLSGFIYALVFLYQITLVNNELMLGARNKAIKTKKDYITLRTARVKKSRKTASVEDSDGRREKIEKTYFGIY